MRRFVDTYNSTYQTNYRLEAYPERENRTTPQPEVLLCDDRTRMVIERKVFAWPPEYIRYHQLWHEFNARFFGRMSEEFPDGIYAFEILKADMPGNKREIVKLADAVTSRILAHRDLITNTGGIQCVNEPIGWKFYRLPDMDREDYPGESGIVVRLMHPFRYYDAGQMTAAQTEIKAALSKLISEAAPKFDSYVGCLRVLVLEPYTDVSNLSPGILRQIVRSIAIPMNIDQIWLAVQIELADDVLILDYRLVTTRDKLQRCMWIP